jgi:hypothetical protein
VIQFIFGDCILESVSRQTAFRQSRVQDWPGDASAGKSNTPVSLTLRRGSRTCEARIFAGRLQRRSSMMRHEIPSAIILLSIKVFLLFPLCCREQLTA